MIAHAWKQVVLSVPAQYQDLLIASLTTIGFNGFLQENGSLACFMEKRAWTRQAEISLRQTLSCFQKEFPQIEVRFTQRDVKQQNWNAAWERSIGIIEATDHIIVKPSWKKLRARDRGKIVLQIDPKMSFGLVITSLRVFVFRFLNATSLPKPACWTLERGRAFSQ